jgi:hypothetical protein
VCVVGLFDDAPLPSISRNGSKSGFGHALPPALELAIFLRLTGTTPLQTGAQSRRFNPGR